MLVQAIKHQGRRGIKAAVSSVFISHLALRIRMNHITCHEEVSAVTKTHCGALIVIEGCDCTGKTTQAKRLVDYMNAKGWKAVFMQFPDRTTPIGGLIDAYLTKVSDLEDHAIHLLFSANRWENLPKILSALQSGTSVIIDRYAYSGVAFSAAKDSLELEWCKGSDTGLPKPDVVLFLDLPPTLAATRDHYGSERYEKLEFQHQVYKNYMTLKDATWKMIDASKSVEEVEASVATAVDEVMEKVKKVKLGLRPLLWQR